MTDTALIRQSLAAWALQYGVLDPNAEAEIKLASEGMPLPLPFEFKHMEYFQNRKILKVQEKGRSLVVVTRLAVAQTKRAELSGLFDKHFEDAGLVLEFAVARPFKVDQKVQPTIKAIFREGAFICCGSSVGQGNQRNAGTLTAIGQKADGTMIGISCNHVVGGCNTSHPGTPIVVPGIQDVSSDNSEIYTIGLHDSSSQMIQGLPSESVPIKNNSDVACFQLSDANQICSLQGYGEQSYDTPTKFAKAKERLKVKKWGRTTGFTQGRVVQVLDDPEPIPYDVTSYFGPTSSQTFKGVVYYQGVIEVESSDFNDFSKAGDSGALVVTDIKGKPSRVVGVLIGGSTGNNAKSYVLPLEPVLKQLKVSLCGGINTKQYD